MAKKVTIYDIADKLLLSPSTVSRALADNPLINEKTRDKVKKAAAEIGYMDSPRYSSEATTIVIVVPEIDNHFYSRIIATIQHNLRGKYLLAIMCSHNSARTEKEIVSRLNPLHTKCLVISQSMDTTESTHIEAAEKKGIPVILFNRINYNGSCPKFLIDDYMDSYILTNHLISIGCKRIAFAAKHFNCPIYKNRIQAYKDVLEKNEIAFNPNYLIYSELTVNDTHEVITRFLNMNPRPDALLLPSYVSALQAISLAKLNNISIPQGLAIVSFDENPECRYSIPSITSIDRPIDEIGQKISETILKICDNTMTEKDSIKVFCSNLIIRGSSFIY